jgi:hypothetical protein
MSITYADQPLLLPDPGRHLSTWLDRALSLKDLRLFGERPIAWEDGRWMPRSKAMAKVGLPKPNWAQFPPRMKINTLWWPTGATRWAVGLFLCGKAALAKIIENLDDKGFATLKLSDDGATGTAHTVSVQMALLPPRPLTATGGPAGDALDDASYDRLFLIPLVDKRYFWQFKDAGELKIEPKTAPDMTWYALIQHLGAQLEEAIEFDPIDGYQYPDPVELSRAYENAAMLLDVVAWCVGRRVVLGLGGTVSLLTPAQSKATHYQNLGGWGAEAPETAPPQLSPFSVWAGGPSQYREKPRRPEKVRVVFPPYNVSRTPWDDGDAYAVEVRGDKYFKDTTPGKNTTPGLVKTFYNTAAARFAESADTPANQSELEHLTDQIAKDYYDWLQAGTYDLSCSGIREWVPTGYDDAIWWHWGYQYPPETEDPLEEDMEMEQGRYGAFTRIHGLPVDWGYSQLLHQFPGYPGREDIVTFRLDADLTLGAAQASVYAWDTAGAGQYADTGDTILAVDVLGTWPDAPSGTWGKARVHRSGNGPVYEIIDLAICTTS